jgi:starch phosphorylase
MKVLVNGGINVSELDGWWAEAYAPDLGWAIGDGQEHHDDPAWDTIEAEMLYTILEREVVSEFYTRDGQGIPMAWVTRIRESMARLTPRFSASRAVREYTDHHYLPAASVYQLRVADKGAIGKQMIDWKKNIEQKWASLHFGEVKIETRDNQYIFEVRVCLNNLDPKAVRLELYADGINNETPIRQEMKCVDQLANSSSDYIYSAVVSKGRPATDYTARVIPHFDEVAVPLENSQILWNR